MASRGEKMLQGSDYFDEERALHGRIMAMQRLDDEEHDMFRPSLADHPKIGFFSQDRNVQTDKTEIVEVKELTEVVQTLLKETADLKRDLHFTRHSLQSDYESKVQQKAIDLYCRINDNTAELEKIHEDRVNVIRRAFRQQLADALVRVNQSHMEHEQQQLDRERQLREKSQQKKERPKKKDPDPGKFEQKYKELLEQVQKNEETIANLEAQVQQLQADADIDPGPSEAEEMLALELEEMNQKARKLEKRANRLEEALELKDEELQQKAAELTAVQESYEKEQALAIKLSEENEELKDSVEKGKASQKRLLTASPQPSLDSLSVSSYEHLSSMSTDLVVADHVSTGSEVVDIVSQCEHASVVSHGSVASYAGPNPVTQVDVKLVESQRLAHEKELEERMKQIKDEIIEKANQETESLLNDERQKYAQLLDQKKAVEEILARERAAQAEKNLEMLDLEKMKRAELKLQAEVARLKREIEKVNRMWEKKFAILQQSLHALKDESFLRQTLQRQAAQLHQASITYATDTPLGILPAKHSTTNVPRKPLPDIPKNTTPKSNAEKDYMSYTVSAPSGRGTGLFSVDENQVMSDDNEQDIPEGTVPLPTPPARTMTECGEESRPSTSSHKSHVVVLPSVQAQ